MPSLTIGSHTARLPIVQGGMAVRISLSPLAGAVAAAGGIGIIAGSGLSPDELRSEIRAARSIADGGLVGVNIMVAISAFREMVQTALDEGIDLVIAGAGFSRDVFGWCKEAGVSHELRDAAMGHAATGQSPFGGFSTLAPSEYLAEMNKSTNEMLAEIRLNPIVSKLVSRQ